MSESTAAAPGFGSYLDEPPLSPEAPDGLRIAQPAAEPETAPPAPPAPVAGTSVEALLLRYHLVTSEQMAQALGERLVTGKDIPTIALEHGWITPDDLAQVQAFGGIEAAVPVAEPLPAPQPVAAAPAPHPQPAAPAPAPVASPVALFVRLANGERIPAGTFATRELAMNEGRLLALRMGHEGEWPFLDERYVRPEAVVSVDVETIAL